MPRVKCKCTANSLGCSLVVLDVLAVEVVFRIGLAKAHRTFKVKPDGRECRKQKCKINFCESVVRGDLPRLRGACTVDRSRRLSPLARRAPILRLVILSRSPLAIIQLFCLRQLSQSRYIDELDSFAFRPENPLLFPRFEQTVYRINGRAYRLR